MNEDFLLAGQIRPGHIISLSGLEADAAEVTEVQPSLSYSHIQITLETGFQRNFPIEMPLPVYEK